MNDPVTAILNGPDYFYCEKLHATITKEVCVKRQQYLEIYRNCQGCQQGLVNIGGSKIKQKSQREYYLMVSKARREEIKNKIAEETERRNKMKAEKQKSTPSKTAPKEEMITVVLRIKGPDLEILRAIDALAQSERRARNDQIMVILEKAVMSEIEIQAAS